MLPTIEQILSAAHADDNTDEPQPMTLRQFRDAIEDVSADLVDDEVPVLVRIRKARGETVIGMLDALTTCAGGGVIIDTHAIQEIEQ